MSIHDIPDFLCGAGGCCYMQHISGPHTWEIPLLKGELMTTYQERPKLVEAVQFHAQSYSQEPFNFNNEKDPSKLPEWVQKLIDREKLTPFYDKSSNVWSYYFIHDEQTITITSGQWLVHNPSRKLRLTPEYQVFTDVDFDLAYMTVSVEES